MSERRPTEAPRPRAGPPSRTDGPTSETGAAVVTLSHAASHAEAAPGGLVLHTLAWSYAGAAGLDRAFVVVELPERCRLQSAAGGSGADADGRRVCWSLGPLAPGASGSLLLGVRLDDVFPAGTTTLKTAARFEVDGVPPVPASPVETRVAAAPALQLVLSADRAQASPAERLTATLSYANLGNADAEDVLVSVAAAPGARAAFADGGGSEWRLPALRSGAMGTAVIGVELDAVFPAGATLVEMSAHVEARGLRASVVRASTLVQAAPQLSVTVAVDRDTAQPGADLRYAVSYQNRGNADATGVVVALPLPPRAAPATSAASWDAARRAVVLRVGDLRAGTGGELLVPVRLDRDFPDGATELLARASASARGLDPVTSEPAHTLVVAAADVVLAVAVDRADAIPGDRLACDLRLENRGGASARASTLTVTLPKGVRVAQATRGGVTDLAAGTVTWALGDVRPGDAPRTLGLALALEAVFPAGTTRIAIHASVRWDSGAVETASPETRVIAAPVLRAELSTDRPQARPGDRLAVRLAFGNAGNADVSAATAIVHFGALARLTEVGTPGDAPGDVVLALGDLAAGATSARMLAVALEPVFPPGTTELELRARLEASGVPAIDVTPATVRVRAAPLLGVRASVDRTEATAGDTLAYTFECENRGDAPATPVDVLAPIPARTTFLMASGGGAQGPNGVHWTLAEVAPGDTVSVGLVVRLDNVWPSGATPVEASVHVRVPGGAAPASATSPRTRVAAAPELALTARAEPRSARPGDRVRLAFSVTGRGTADAQAAVLATRVPARCRFVAASDGGSLDGAAVRWPLRHVAVGATVTRSLDLELDPVFPAGETPIEVSAALVCPGAPDVSATTDVAVTAAPGLAVSVAIGTATASPGDQLAFAIRYRNTGNADAVNVCLIDPLPTRATFLSATLGGVYDEEANAVTWRVGTLPGGQAGEVVLTLRLDPEFPPGRTELTNGAAIQEGDLPAVFSEDVSCVVLAVPVPRATLSLDRVAVRPGDTIDASLTWDVAGTGAASRLSAHLALPSGLEVLEATGDGVVEPGRRGVRWPLGAHVHPGTSGGASAVLRVGRDFASGATPLTLLLALRCDELGAVEGRSASLVVAAAPQLRATIALSAEAAEPGDRLEVVLTVANAGDAVARAVEIALPRPEHGRLEPGRDLTADSDRVLWRLPALGVGAEASVRLPLALDGVFPPGRTPVEVGATVACDDIASAALTPALVGVTAAPALDAEVTVDRPEVRAGESLDVKFKVRNKGNAPARSLVVRCPTPAGASVIAAAPESAAEARYGAVRFALPELDPGAEALLSLALRFDPPFPAGRTTLTVSAEVSADLAEARAAATVDVEAAPELALLVDLPATAEPGAELALRARVENRGTAVARAVILAVEAPERMSMAEPGPWPLGAIEPGQGADVTALLHLEPVFPEGPTPLTLNAIVRSADAEPCAQPSHLVVWALPAPVLQLTADSERAAPGDALRYAMCWRNNGNADASGARIVLTPPERCTIEGPCERSIGELPVGVRGEAAIVARLAAAFPAGATALELLAHLVWDSGETAASAVTTVVASRRLRVALEVDAAEAAPGATLRFTLRAVNAGDADSGPATLVFTLPERSALASASDGASLDQAMGACLFALGPLAAGVERRCEATLALDPTFPAGTTTLVARALLRDADPGEATAEATARVVAGPRVTLRAEADRASARPGEAVSIAVNYAVSGDAHAEGLEVRLRLPSGVQADGPVTWPIGRARIGASGVVRVAARIAADAPDGPLEIAAEATAGGIAGVRAEPARVQVVSPRLELGLAVPDRAAPGETVAVTVRARNAGAAASDPATLSLQLPPRMSATAAPGAGHDAGWLVWRLDALPAGADVVVTAEVALDRAFPAGATVATVQATLRAGTTALDAESRVHVDAAPRLGLQLALDRSEARPGARVGGAVSYAVEGVAHAEALQVRLALPGRVGVDAGDGVVLRGENGATVTWNLGRVAVGEGGTLPFELQLDPAFPEGVTVVDVRATATAPDAPPAAADPLQIAVASPRLVLAVDAPEHADPGETIRCVARVTNAGAAASDPMDVTLAVPDHAALLGGGAWAVDALAPGDGVALEATIALDRAFPAGTTASTVTASLRSMDVALEASAVTLVSAAPKLALRIEADRAEARPGGAVLLTLHWTVSGVADADDLTIRVGCPDRSGFEPADGAAIRGRVVSWALGRVAVGGSGVLAVVARFGTDFPDGVTSLAFAAVAEAHEALPASSAVEVAVASPRVVLVLSADRERAAPGDTVTWTARVVNEGAGASDPLTLVWAPPERAASTTPASVPVGVLAPGEERVHSLTATLDTAFPAGTTDVTVLATVADRRAEATTRVAAAPVLTARVEALTPSARPGGLLDFAVHWSVSGAADAESLAVRATLPPRLAVEPGSGGVPDEDGATWTLGRAVVGLSGTVTFRARASADFPDGVTVLEVAAEAAAPHAIAAVCAPARVEIAAPRVVVRLTLDPERAAPGDTVVVVMDVVNEGDAQSDPVGLSLLVPERGTLAGDAQVELGTLAAGDALRRTASLALDRVFPAGESALVVAALVSSGARCERSLAVTAAPAIALRLDADRTDARPGDVVACTLRYAVSGSADADDLVLQLALPDGLDATETTWRLGRVLVGQTGTARAEVRVARTFSAGRTPLSLAATATARHATAEAAPLALTIEAAAAVSITIGLPPSARPGQTAACEIALENRGDAAAEAMALALELPPHVSGEATFDVAAIPAGATATLTAALTLAPVFAAGRTLLPIRATSPLCRAEATLAVDAAPRVVLEARFEPERARPGERVRLHLDWRNEGDADAPAASAEVALDARTSLAGPPLAAPGALAAGASGSASLDVAVDARLPAGETAIVARVLLGDVAAAATLVVHAAPALGVTAALESGKTQPGGRIVYRVEARNHGDADATSVALGLILPVHVTATEVAPAVATLPPGERMTLRVPAQLAATFPDGTTSIRATPTVFAAETGTVRGEPAVFEVTAAPALSVRSEALGSATPGQELELSIACENSGTAAATDVVLSDVLPERTSFVDAGEGGVYDPRTRTVVWPAQTIAPGPATARRLRVRLDAVFPLGHTSIADRPSAGGLAGQPARLDVAAAPALAVQVTAEPLAARPGDAVRFSIRVANDGAADATDVVVSNPLPPNVAVDGATARGAYDAEADAVVWGPLRVPAGAAVTFGWSGRLDRAFPAGDTCVTDLAVARLPDGDAVLSDEVTVVVSAAPRPRVVLTLEPPRARPGDVVTCRLHATNEGDAPSRDAVLQMDLPRELRSEDQDRVTWSLGTLAPGGAEARTVALSIAPVLPAGATTLELWASLETLELPPVRSSPVGCRVDAAPRLTLDAALSPAELGAGEPLRLGLRYANVGDADVSGVVLAVAIPGAVTLEDRSEGGALDDSGERLMWSLGNLAAGASGVASLEARVRPVLSPGETRIVFSPALTGLGAEPAPARPATAVAMAAAHVQAIAEVDRAAARPGDALTYRVVLGNTGSAEARRLSVTMALPPRCTLAVATDGATYEARQHAIKHPLGTLPAGEERSLTATVRLAATFPSGTTGLACTVQVDGEQAPWRETLATEVTASPALRAEVTFDRTDAAPGDTVVATVRVANDGDADATDAGLVVRLPPRLTLLQAAGGRQDGDAVTWPLGAVKAGASGAVKLPVQLDATFPSGETHLAVAAEVRCGETGAAASEAALRVTAAPVLAVALAVDPKDARPGDVLVVTAAVENTGSAVAEDVALTLDPPGGGAPVTMAIGALTPRERTRRTLSVRLEPVFPAGVTAATARACVTATNAPDAEATARATVRAAPTVSVELSDLRPSAAPGDTLTAAVAWRNSGDAEATGGVVSMALPSRSTLVAGGTLDAGVIRWTLGPLAPGEAGDAEVTLRLDDVFPEGATKLVLAAELACAEAPPVRSAPHAVEVLARSELVVSETSEVSVSTNAAPAAKSGPARAGSATTGVTLTLRLSVANHGNADAANAELVHDLPPGAQFVSASDGGAPDRPGRRVAWRLGTVAAGTDGLVRTVVVRFGA